MEPSPTWEANSYAAMQEFPKNLWNLKVHCSVHKSLPLVTIMHQINPVYTTQSCFSNIHFNIPHLCASHVCCMLPISPSLTWSLWFFFKSTFYRVPHYTVFSNLELFRPSCIHIFSAPYSQTPSLCVPPLISGTKFHAAQNYRQNYSFVYFELYVYRQQTRREKVLNWMVASIMWIESAHKFLMNQILICYCCSRGTR
jgi:hypothetical protein